MAKNPETLGVFDSPESTEEKPFARETNPDVVLESAIFDEATCGTTSDETIPYLTPVGIITASGLDSDGRVTVGVHDAAAVDGRQNVDGFLLHNIYEADGSRGTPVDCPCSFIRAGAINRSKIPAGSLTAAVELALRKSNPNLQLIEEVA